MMTRTPIPLILFIACMASLLAATSGAPQNAGSPVDSMERKLQYVQQNGAQATPDPKPTEFTEQEVNAYVASGRVKLPAGVQSVRFEGQPNVIRGIARVDFDQLKAGRNSSNPLLSVFSGVHDVLVVAQARGVNHMGYVEVQSVSLDDVEIPRFVLQVFVQKYLQPKYPNVGLNSQFALPAKVDTATVGQSKVTITQK
jgi:hypothetical protein